MRGRDFYSGDPSREVSGRESGAMTPRCRKGRRRGADTTRSAGSNGQGVLRTRRLLALIATGGGTSASSKRYCKNITASNTYVFARVQATSTTAVRWQRRRLHTHRARRCRCKRLPARYLSAVDGLRLALRPGTRMAAGAKASRDQRKHLSTRVADSASQAAAASCASAGVLANLHAWSSPQRPAYERR